MQHEQVHLSNNLKTLFIDSPGSIAASVQVWFRAGSALEEKTNQGIAHFLEHMFFKGTPTRPGSLIAHQVESMGGELNAFTSFDYTCYYINTPTNHLKESIEILLDMVSHPTFKQDDLIPERDVVFEEFRRSQDNPGQFSFQKLQEEVFTGGYRHPILGNKKTILNFNREQLIDFRKKYYNLSNALFVVAGDLSGKSKKSELSKTIETFKVPEGPQSTFPDFKLRNNSTTGIHKKDVKMAQLYLCLQAPSFNERESAPEDLAFNCLGHGETSRLYKNLVIDGSLANSTGCSTMFMNKGGIHFMRVSFPPENLNLIIKRLEAVILEALKNGFDEKEIQRIKNQYISSKIYDRETVESYAFSLGHSFAQTGAISAEEEFIERIRKTSPAAVNSALKRIFSNPLHLNLQIPQSLEVKKINPILKKFQDSFEKKIQTLKKQNKSKYKITKSKHDPQVLLLKLKSGVNFIYRHNPINPTFVLHSYIRGGITEETSKTNGFHQALSGVLTKGYKKTKYENLRADLENKSATLHGFSGKNSYGLTMHGQSEHFENLTTHFFGSLLFPSMPIARIKHEKEMTLRNLKARQVNPVKQCFDEISKLFFNGHPYSMPLLGNEKSVKSINRKSLLELHNKNLSNKELLFTYCGDCELEEVLDILEPHLHQIHSRPSKKPRIKKVKPLINKKQFIEFDREQTQIFYGIPTARLGSQETLYLKMLTAHLSGQSSELFVEVRDRQGLCYTAQPINFSAMEAGYWGIYMASGYDKVQAALVAIQDIIENIRENGLTKNQFHRIKNMIQGQALLNVQTNDDFANIYSITTLQGYKLDYYHLENKAIEELSYQNFQTSIKKILNRRWNTILVGRR